MNNNNIKYANTISKSWEIIGTQFYRVSINWKMFDNVFVGRLNNRTQLEFKKSIIRLQYTYLQAILT